jgi:hypothetical protein
MLRVEVEALGYIDPEDFAAEGVVLTDDRGGEGHTLELQRSLAEPDEQDIELGMDTYCLVVDLGATVYGGVQRWTLIAGELRLELEPWAARELGVDAELVYDLTRVDASELRPMLERLFR